MKSSLKINNWIVKNCKELLLSLVLITLLFGGRAFNSNAIFLFLCYSIYNFIVKKKEIYSNQLVIVYISFYFFGFLSLFWSNSFTETKLALVRFLPFFILNIIVLFTFKTKIILEVFSKSVVFICFYCFLMGVLNSIINDNINYLFYHDLSSNLGDINAIYLSVFVSFVILFFLYNKFKYKLLYLVFLFVFLILLSSKMVICITIFNLLIYFITGKKFKTNKKKYITLIIAFIIAISASINLTKRIQVEFEKTKMNEVLTTKDFGHVYIWTGFGLRIFQIKMFLEILHEENNYLLGSGLGNAQSLLTKKYKEYNLYPGFYYYNYHNQFIQTFAELGVVGLLLMMYSFFLLFKKSVIEKDYFLLSFVFLCISVCLTESFLSRQRGIVFFVTISLLLYNQKKQICTTTKTLRKTSINE